MKTPRGWILTDESVNRIVETEFRERNAQVETRMKNDPEFKLIYQKDHGEGNTSFTSPKGNFSVREVAAIRLRNSGKNTNAKNLISLFSSDTQTWVIPMIEGNVSLEDKIWELILKNGQCELYLRKDKNSAPYRVLAKDKGGRIEFVKAEKREGTHQEWNESVGNVLDMGLSGPKFYSVDIVTPDEPLEKARAAMIGEERTWGGKVYVRTTKGWRPKGKGSSSANQDEQGKNQTSRSENKVQDKRAVLEEYAANATDQQLESAIKKPGQSDEVKQIARQELESRNVSAKEEADEISDALNRLLESDEFDDEFKRRVKEKLDERNAKKQEKQKDSIRDELDSFKKEINQRLDKLEQENSGHKQIKKTGIVVDGKKIFITMNGDRYQARRGGETLKSEPGESLSSFKDKVRKNWEGKLNTTDTTPNELPKNEEVESAVERVRDIIKKSRVAKSASYHTVLREPNKALYMPTSKRDQLQVNAALLEKGLKPVMEPFLFTEHDNEQYQCYDGYFMDEKQAIEEYRMKFMPLKDNLSESERTAITDYEEGYDAAVRGLNSGTMDDDNPIRNRVVKIDNELAKYVDKNRIDDNIILSRRLNFKGGNNPFSKLKKGDTFTDPSFSSFSLTQMKGFGIDFQITLLAKKGQPVSPIGILYSEETEFLVQKGSKFKVIETGFNSIAVEIVD